MRTSFGSLPVASVQLSVPITGLEANVKCRIGFLGTPDAASTDNIEDKFLENICLYVKGFKPSAMKPRTMQRVLVVGLGEVGQALLEVIKASGSSVAGLDVDKQKMLSCEMDFVPYGRPIDVLHLAFPCKKRSVYVALALEYILSVKPKLVIIDSTVTPGTTKEVEAKALEKLKDVLVAYSPVRGMTKNDMKKELLRYTKFVAGVSQEAAEATKQHFTSVGMKVKMLENVTALEWAKIFETSYRAAMIATFQEFHRICHCYKVKLTDALELIADDDAVLKDKPICYPGVIDGHCLMPNTDLLLEAYRSAIFRWVKRSNGDRRIEVLDPNVRVEIDQIQRRVEAS